MSAKMNHEELVELLQEGKIGFLRFVMDSVFWVAVVEGTVVIKPSTIPNLSFSTLAIGARQFVVQDAFETIV